MSQFYRNQDLLRRPMPTPKGFWETTAPGSYLWNPAVSSQSGAEGWEGAGASGCPDPKMGLTPNTPCP